MQKLLILPALCFLSTVTICPLLGSSHAVAAIVTLTDENSTATVNTSTQVGMSDWVVDGVDHMNQQWFWYRLGSTGKEKSIDTLIQTSSTVSDTDGDGDNDTLNIRYTNSLPAAANKFQIEVRFSLRGSAPGSGIAAIDESIAITNQSNASGPASTESIHFFQYSDYDLNGPEAFDNETVFIESAANGDSAVQQDPGPGLTTVSENAANPKPNRREAAFYGTTLAKLNDAVSSNLSGTTAAGPGNVTWAFQWDTSILKGRSFNISKNKTLESVPEPTSFILLGLCGLAGLRRRR